MQIPVDIDIYGETIRGIFHASVQAENCNLYVMCYGYNGDMCEVNRLTRRLGIYCEEHGHLFLRIDYRSQGVSDGKSMDISMQRKVKDIEAALLFAQGCIGSNKCRIYLIGFSDGAKVALEVAKRVKVEKLVLWNPILNMAYISNLYNERHSSSKKLYKDLDTGKYLTDLFGLGISLKYLNEVMKTDLEKDLLDTNVPIKCIWGEKDIYTKSLREKCIIRNNPYIENRVIENATHLFGDEKHQQKLFFYTIEEE